MPLRRQSAAAFTDLPKRTQCPVTCCEAAARIGIDFAMTFLMIRGLSGEVTQMQIGVSHYVQNQSMMHSQKSVESTAAEVVDASPESGTAFQDDAVSWSDRLYELHALARDVKLSEANFAEVGQLRQALFERGWISPAQATALTELGNRLSDRLTYPLDEIISQGMSRGGQARQLLGPVLTMVRNVESVQALQQQGRAA